VRPVCAACGTEYQGGRLKEEQGRTRGYVHADVKERMHPEAYARCKQRGCKRYVVLADELENAIKDLIVRQRASLGYADDVRC
jgi:hypothetical protein